MRTAPTIFVNLFSGAGAGKSGVAAGVYSQLKALHQSVELVREVAKEYLWGEELANFGNQVLITANQYHRQLVLDGKVSIVVTDSPLLLGLVYPSKRGCNLHWRNGVVGQFKEFTGLNFYLVRAHAYSPEGRVESEERAIRKDIELRALMDSVGLQYTDVLVNSDTVGRIVSAVLARVTS